MACKDLDSLWKEYFRDCTQLDSPWAQEQPSRRSRVKSKDRDFTALLDSIKACGRQKDLHTGSRIHAHILKSGSLRRDIYISSALLRMYTKCGALTKAQEVFDELPRQDAVCWTALIAGYAQHGLSEEALNCYGRMRAEGFSPDAFTFACVLKACGSVGAIEKGEEIHDEVHRLGLLENHDIVLGTALVDMYAKCSLLAKAQEVFDGLPTQDAVSWSALITGYAQLGLGEEALNCFDRMRDEGFFPDAVTFLCILKACGSIGALEKGKEIHAEICRLGLFKQHDIILGTALVDMYGKCGELAKAQELFDGLSIQNEVSWTALIAGYAEHGHADEALNCFRCMQDEGVSPNAITFACVLKACGSIGAIMKGKEIHAEVCRLGLLKNHDMVLATALVDMYAKSGMLTKAQEIFDELPVRNVVSWNALIAGYARLGKAKTVFNLFCKMREECIEPNDVTFLVLLTACSHAGLVEEGQIFFDIMSTVHCLIPTSEHLLCMVDLFRRTGRFDKALSVMKEVPDCDSRLVLFGTCQNLVNLELGRCAFEQALQLDGESPAAYVCMSNIYAAAGIQSQEG